jgi:hypothetical protein
MQPVRKPVEPTLAQCRRIAEIIPHPAMRLRFAQERLGHIAKIQSSFGRHRPLGDAVRQHRKRLEQLAVSPPRIEAEIDELEDALFRVHHAAPNAVFRFSQ